MSLVFKLTIPDGALAQYLSTMSSKARNFEIVRLATNDLIRMQQPQSTFDNNVSNEGRGNKQNEFEQSDSAYSSSYFGMHNDTSNSYKTDNSHETENDAGTLGSDKVDFGAELLDMT